MFSLQPWRHTGRRRALKSLRKFLLRKKIQPIQPLGTNSFHVSELHFQPLFTQNHLQQVKSNSFNGYIPGSER